MSSISRYFIGIFLCMPFISFAATLQFGPISVDEGQLSPALQAFAVLTLLSLAPSLLIMLSSFTRIVIVLSLLRSALGLQQTPPNMVIMCLSLFLTLFTMMPVAETIYKKSWQPYEAHQISIHTAIYRAVKPLKQFMLQQTRDQELATIMHLAKQPMPASAKEVQLHQLIPAFLLSELQTAFQIGFMIFLPFLLVDLIVSGILMTMGMMMMPPTSISLPIKIILFVLINGWDLVVQALVGSFQ
jgi:flagellar biosynthetic protein FliP